MFDLLTQPLSRGSTLIMLDAVALIWFTALWWGMGWWVQYGPQHGRTTSAIMAEKRRDWMREMVYRENRMLDAGVLQSLQNGAAFFASTSMLAIGGLVAMFGQADTLVEATRNLPLGHPVGETDFRMRLLAPMVTLSFAFFKFAWAHRLFGYCAVLIGATPSLETGTEAQALRAAERAARVNIAAGRNFTSGLRATYFTMGALTWLVGPVALILGAAGIALMIQRREFRSRSRAAILDREE